MVKLGDEIKEQKPAEKPKASPKKAVKSSGSKRNNQT